MNDNFREGSWVFYNNPGHHFHLMMFQIQKIVPMTMNSPGGYDLVYGARSIFAKCDELLHRGDPKIPNMVLNPLNHSAFHVDTATGDHLDRLAELHGLRRTTAETDDSFRTRTLKAAKSWTNSEEKKSAHEGHEVVENYAGGKPFKYCRNCKVEVSE